MKKRVDIKHLKLLANKNDFNAIFNLGCLYYKGEIVKKDYAKAFEFWMRLADLNDPRSQYNIGCMYENGLHVEKNFDEALKWYKIAADNGSLEARDRISNCHKYGHGLPQDPKKSHVIDKASAKQGSSSALVRLAIYHYEKGTPESRRKYLQLLGKAVKKGDAQGMYKLALSCLSGESGILQPDKKRAHELLLRSAKKHYPDAQACLGYKSITGRDLPLNPQKGLSWLKTAAEGGSAEAMSSLGMVYFYDHGFGVDREEALKWISRAAEKKDPIALHNLGVFHLIGLLTEKDLAKAAAYFESAAEKNFYAAMHNLAIMHFRGLFFDEDKVEAYNIFLKLITIINKNLSKYNVSNYKYGNILFNDTSENLVFLKFLADEKELPIFLLVDIIKTINITKPDDIIIIDSLDSQYKYVIDLTTRCINNQLTEEEKNDKSLKYTQYFSVEDAKRDLYFFKTGLCGFYFSETPINICK
ncbi:MAG: sel1 repeat family protein [Deltaproteobacteria bacterium]|jgi:TPR repeat protein|nr:sel1 repeat family protein [Deltaproteobacteria bacterium]